jgi:hypothetical protein
MYMLGGPFIAMTYKSTGLLTVLFLVQGVGETLYEIVSTTY